MKTGEMNDISIGFQMTQSLKVRSFVAICEFSSVH